MQEITRLQMQRGGRARVNLHLDGEYAFSLALDLAAGLRRGQQLDAEAIADLRREDAYRRALDAAMHYLAHRPRSRREVWDRLREKDFEEPAIERACARLEELDLLDDARFAEWWVSNRLQHRPRGARALRSELMQRGLPDPIIRQVTADIDETGLARQLALSRAERHRGQDRRLFERRLGSWLQRRGFGWEAVREALAAAWQSLEPPPDTP